MVNTAPPVDGKFMLENTLELRSCRKSLDSSTEVLLIFAATETTRHELRSIRGKALSETCELLNQNVASLEVEMFALVMKRERKLESQSPNPKPKNVIPSEDVVT